MPSMYPDGEYDLAGFAVGVVEKDKIIDGKKLKPGDVVLGLKSNGVHSNGYSLVRKIIEHSKLDLSTKYDENQTWGQAILAPTKIYVKPILDLIKQIDVHGMSHITGGGITGNLPRVFPKHLAAQIKLANLPKTKLFDWLKGTANLNDLQMLETFNCGVGYVVIVDAADVAQTIQILHKHQIETYNLGTIIDRTNNEIEYI